MSDHRQPTNPQRFWETVALDEMSDTQWESICDGCGLCCLHKLEDPDTNEIALTRISCRLLDDQTCQCTHYDGRHQIVPDCIRLTIDTLPVHAYWLPDTCAYKLLWQGKALYDWHPLISGNMNTVHDARISARGQTIPEFDVPEEDWDEYIINTRP